MLKSRSEIFTELQSNILRLQGHSPSINYAVDDNLGPIKDAFPKGSFPLGAVHEFLSAEPEEAAAINGFISGLLSSLMGSNGVSLWISSSRKLFPPALKSFGLSPDRIIFIDLLKEKDVLWTMDEALKCGALTAVVCEVRDLSFMASRRLQLAVEQSSVTGFVIRHTAGKQIGNLNTTACVSRWKISSLKSESIEGLPGIGFPTWRVELLRIRNGKTGIWDIQCVNGKFVHAFREHSVSRAIAEEIREAG